MVHFQEMHFYQQVHFGYVARIGAMSSFLLSTAYFSFHTMPGASLKF